MSTGGAVQLPHPLKQKITDEILQRLKGLNGNGTANEQKGQHKLALMSCARYFPPFNL